jgi:hypothetical protein
VHFVKLQNVAVTVVQAVVAQHMGVFVVRRVRV